MMIAKEYNHATNPPTLMNPWDYQVAAAIEARFGIGKPRVHFDVARYVRAVAEVVQDHGTELSFGSFKYHVGNLAHARTHGYALIVNGSEGDVIVGHGATASLCKAVKGLIEAGALEVLMPSCAMRFYPANDAPKLDGATVRVVKGPPP